MLALWISPHFKEYFYLGLSIGLEITGTSAMKTTQGFTKPIASILVLLAYCLAGYFFSKTLDRIPLGIVYAIWCGVGIIVVSGIAYFAYGQKLDWPAVAGMLMILSGVVTIHLYSKILA
jgi:small multidrug resistance pump